MKKRQHRLQRRQFLELRAKLASEIARFQPDLRKTLLNNLSELVAAVTLAHSVQLARLGAELPVDSSAESREQWGRRQLANPTRGTLELFKPLAQALLQGFAGKKLYLLLDPTDLAADLTIIMLAVAYRGRALPLAWLTVYVKPDTVQEGVTYLFNPIQAWLPADAQVYLLADREFRGQDMLTLIQAHHWTPVVRLKGDTQVELPDGRVQLAQALAPKPGQTAFYPRVWLTVRCRGPYSLALANAPKAKRGQKPEDPWYIVSTGATDGRYLLQLYAKRMGVDEMFRDFKGQGYHLEQTRLTDPRRLDRLVLVVALAYWGALRLGIWVDRLPLRRRVDRSKHGRCSLFTVGLRWIKRLLTLDKLPDTFLIPVL